MNFSYLRREPGFYRRVFTLALPVVLQNLITTSLSHIIFILSTCCHLACYSLCLFCQWSAFPTRK